MLRRMKNLIVGFYTNEKELNITLFKLLGTAGILVSIYGCLQSLITSDDYIGALINFFAIVASVLLLSFVHITKKYTAGYLITSFSIFIVLFVWLFMEMGGLNGSMPYFFGFAIVFTLMMYRGKLLLAVELIQIAVYLFACHFAVLHPEYIKDFDTPREQFIDQMSGIFISSLGIGVIFLLYLREYRKQQKLAEESSNAKSVLLANVSHEIRTPINMLLGMNEMILRESDNSQIREYAQNVESSGRQLLYMVNQILDFSRLDMGKEELFEENFNIKKLIDGLSAFFGNEAEKRNVDFILNYDKNIPQFIYSDAKKLSQILTNLLSNAVKYTDTGKITFSVQELGGDLEKRLIRFEVSDTGKGIAPEDCKKIFESFERANISKNRSIEGTGLGLSISNELARLMGSEIKLESRLDEGSKFWLELYLKPGDEAAEQAQSESSFIAPEAKLLVVDDNIMNLQVIKSLLKRTMVSLDFASSAMECYKKYEETDYDAVLMDYMMPEINGVEAMRHLKDMDRLRNRKTPVIVLTADATPEKREMFIESGFDDYLLKPVDSVLLEQALMRNLPERLVTIINADAAAEIPPELRAELSSLLKKYDLSLDLALKYLSGDLFQLAKVGRFFVKSSEENIPRLSRCIEAGDYAAAVNLVHSLKGSSGNIGAEELYKSAKLLEKHLREEDYEYVALAHPLFVFKWKRAEAGIKELISALEAYSASAPEPKGESGAVHDEKELWEQLLQAVRLGNQAPALKITDELAAIRGKDELIVSIRENIMGIEFAKAEELIKSSFCEFPEGR